MHRLKMLALTVFILMLFLLIPSGDSTISKLKTTAYSPFLQKPSINISWEDTRNNSQYNVTVDRISLLNVSGTLKTVVKIVNVTQFTAVYLDFYAVYEFTVESYDGSTLKAQQKTADVAIPNVVSSTEVQVLLTAYTGATYYQIIVMELGPNITSERELETNFSTILSGAYIAVQVSVIEDAVNGVMVVMVGDGNFSQNSVYPNPPLLADNYYSFIQRSRVGNDYIYYKWTPILSTLSTVEARITQLSSGEIIGLIVAIAAVSIMVATMVICMCNWKYSNKYRSKAVTKTINPVQRLITDPGIPVTEEEFYNHVIQLKLHNSKGFYDEYAALEKAFNDEEEKRVDDEDGDEDGDNQHPSKVPLDGNTFLYANFIPGVFVDNEYIYTQHPLSQTVDDFWGMVWQQECIIVVMIGSFIERGEQVCAHYFPDGPDSDVDCDFDVQFLDVHKTTDYIITTLLLCNYDGEERVIKHYQFTSWPTNQITPIHAYPFLQMVLVIAKSIRKRPAKPIVVHGSADSSRAGVYACIDSEIQRFTKQGDLSIYGAVMMCKRNRHDGVKDLEEYIFIHDAVLEAVILKNVDNINVEDLPKYVDKASRANEELFATEFNFLASTTMQNTQKMAAASRPCNMLKNRYPNIKPYDYNRVKISKMKNEEGSDYINANFIDTYLHKADFITTQAPVEDTINDFWRMIGESKSWVIILLGPEIENGQIKINRFWPEEGYAMSLGALTIKLLSTSRDNIPDVWIRQVEILNEERKTQLVQFYQYYSWPNPSDGAESRSVNSLLQLLAQSELWKHKLKAKKITVMSSSGIGRPGVLMGLRSLQEEAVAEGSINVFRTVHRLNQQRHSLIQSREDYALMYKASLVMTEEMIRGGIINESYVDMDDADSYFDESTAASTADTSIA